MDDNKTYRDMYHFKGRLGSIKLSDELPSLIPDNKDVKSIIKENPYEESNVEIEGGEVVLQPDLSALFKASGKKHSKGGMDVWLKPESFVFSANKSLEFSEDDHDFLELKMGGKTTPAEVLRKNIDLKHYNALVQNISDPRKDDLAKKSSAMMLEKYVDMLGKIAYTQEKKKNFPQGTPDFFSGYIPPENDELEDEIESQKQYAKYGGKILPKYALAGSFPDDECPCGRDASGKCLPCDDASKWDPYIKKAKVVGAPLKGYNDVFSRSDGRLQQQFLPGASGRKPTAEEEAQYMTYLNSLPKERKDAIIKANIEAGKKKRVAGDNFAWIPNINIDQQHENLDLQQSPNLDDPYLDSPAIREDNSIPTNDLFPNEISGEAGRRDVNWQFTPWQKLSQLYSASKMATAKRYMPFRSRFNPSYNEDYLVNPQQAIGDVKAVGNSMTSAALKSLNPILGLAQAQAASGNVMNQVPGIYSQYDNQNAQIKNQGSAMRSQIANNARMTNMQNDQRYYQESVVARQNFDNLRTFTSDQYMNNLLRDVETNQALAYSLASNPNPAFGFDFKSGNFYLTGKDPLSVSGASGSDSYDKLFKGLENLSDSDPKKWEIYERVLRQKNVLPYLAQQGQPRFKMGGKLRGKK
jgi:hypothetical protein